MIPKLLSGFAVEFCKWWHLAENAQVEYELIEVLEKGKKIKKAAVSCAME